MPVPEIYFDSASTTPLDKEVYKTYIDLLQRYFYNADSLYDKGVEVYRLLEKARSNIAKLLDVKSDEIIFTSGASEANSLAIKGLCMQKKKGHIISSIMEHASVYNALRQMERVFGINVTYLKPDKNGLITKEMVESAIRPDTFLVSLMAVNNEAGTIYDINGISALIKKKTGILFHSDMTQALGKIEVDLKDVDMASFSAHKIHGLKGSGFFYRKKHIELEPLISGGQQEFGLRGGTENALTNIVLAKTLRKALEEREKRYEIVKELKEYCETKLKEIRGVKINKSANDIAYILNISTSLKSEVALNALNAKGIMVSTRSTCGSRENEPSRVLVALGVDDSEAIRLSFDYFNTKEEIDYFIETLKGILEKYGN